MTRTRDTGLALLAATALAIAGCGGQDEPSQAPPPSQAELATTTSSAPTSATWPTLEPGSGLPDAAAAANVDTSDPEQVALEAMRIIHTRDTTLEQRSGDSFARAADLMTDSLRDELIVDSSSARPSRQWSEWVQREASIVAKTEIMVEEHPADEPDRWRRAVEVDEYVTASDGSKLGQYRVVNYVDVRNIDGAWRVDDIQLGERLPARR